MTAPDNLGPPWVLFVDRDETGEKRPVAILPAGRPGELKVEGLTMEQAQAIVDAGNARLRVEVPVAVKLPASTACLCGWRMPKEFGVSVPVGATSPDHIVIEFACPGCGVRVLKQLGQKRDPGGNN